jgi:hypothetical protein
LALPQGSAALMPPATIEARAPGNMIAPQSAVWAGGPLFLPNIYFNGFSLTLAASDISLLIALDGQPQAKLSMSFTTAKTLSAYLEEVIAKLEHVTNHTIMKTDEVEAGLKAASSTGPIA